MSINIIGIKINVKMYRYLPKELFCALIAVEMTEYVVPCRLIIANWVVSNCLLSVRNFNDSSVSTLVGSKSVERVRSAVMILCCCDCAKCFST